LLLVAIFAAAVAFTGCGGGSESSGSGTASAADEEEGGADAILTLAAQQVNEQCPLVVDFDTTLESVEALAGKTLRYNYTLVNYSKADMTDELSESVQAILAPTLIETVKTADEMKTLRDYGTSFQHAYYSNDGVELFVLNVTPEDYAE